MCLSWSKRFDWAESTVRQASVRDASALTSSFDQRRCLGGEGIAHDGAPVRVLSVGAPFLLTQSPSTWPTPFCSGLDQSPFLALPWNAVDVMMDMAHDMIMKRVYTWHAHTRIIGWTGMPGHAR